MNRLRPLLLAPVLLAVVLAGCSDDDDGGAVATEGTESPSTTMGATDDAYGGPGGASTDGGESSMEGSEVKAEGFAFTSATVAPGSEVTFTNADGAGHTLTADDGAFDTGTVSGGDSATFTAPSEPGEYAFHCTIHPSMTGTLTVEG